MPSTTPSSASRKSLIDTGQAETANLSECLKVDFEILFQSVIPGARKSSREMVSNLRDLGILAKMHAMGQLLRDEVGEDQLNDLGRHPSDTVRSWAAFAAGKRSHTSVHQKLEAMRPFADDRHFGVREWAWMAVRDFICANVRESIDVLKGWTSSDSFRIRRFASEATRPRGVWAAHINELKSAPELGLPILQNLNSDSERYVQDSVANWLNDAAKSQPAWVKSVCASWTREQSSPATQYIVKRAQRSIK